MILFSYDIFSAQTVGGVSRCLIELMRALADIGVDWRLWAGRHRNEFLAASSATSPFNTRVLAALQAPAMSRLMGSLYNEVFFSRTVRKLKPRVVHRSYFPAFDWVDAETPRVEILHDMWDERAARDGSRSSWLKCLIKRRALQRADRIVCVSNSTRDELLDLFPFFAPRVCVVPHGVRRLAESAEATTAPQPYFLYVGRRDTYKNFAIVLAALKHPMLREHNLICFGGGAFAPHEAELISAGGLRDRVHQFGGSDAVLAGLYERAAALLYPSRYEGFGLPLLEAMIHGCPVIAAPLTSLPEVGGDAAIYADADDEEAWSAAMICLSHDADERQFWQVKGLERAAGFSWMRAAENYAKIYDELAAPQR